MDKFKIREAHQVPAKTTVIARTDGQPMHGTDYIVINADKPHAKDVYKVLARYGYNIPEYNEKYGIDPDEFMRVMNSSLAIITKRVLEELKRGKNKYGPYSSFHEAHSVIEEEFDELWEEIKKKQPNPSRIISEAIQVAATALRLAAETFEKIETDTLNKSDHGQ